MNRRPTARVLIVTGPTGVGKTEIGLEIAARCDGEIVGADSIQVYRGMDIGSAKPTPEERRRVPHHLIDVADPDEPFSAGRYAGLAARAIEDIAGRGKRALLVGGSGLYLRALLEGLVAGVAADPEVRRRIAERLAREGVEALRERLRRVDPPSAARIHANDAYRLTRALEVFELTGRPLSVLHADQGRRTQRFEAGWIGLTEERPVLHARIDERCERMIEMGLLDEVKRLRAAGYDLDLRPLRSLGYRQMGDVIRGDRTLPEALAEMKKQTRRYAKRQLTWFRALPEIAWFSPSRQRENVLDRARRFFAQGQVA